MYVVRLDEVLSRGGGIRNAVKQKTRQKTKRRREERERQINQRGKARTNTPIPLSSDKGKHAERPKCGLPQINILLLFVWEKRPPSPWELHLSQELVAHAVLRRRPRRSTLVKSVPAPAATGITTGRTCSASASPGVGGGHKRCNRPRAGTNTLRYGTHL